jgi:VanZ family protein
LNLPFLRSGKFLYYWLPPLAWCGAVLTLSGDLGSSRNTLGLLNWLLSWFPPLSPAQLDLVHFYFRKTLGHFGNYAFVYFLWFRAFRGQMGYQPGRAFLWSLGLCLSLALLDEGHQALFPSRGSNLRDVALDLAGALTAALITSIFRTPRQAAGRNDKFTEAYPGE